MKMTNIIVPDRILVHHVTTGEDILSTVLESVTQFKLLIDSHSVKIVFLYVVSGGGNNRCQTTLRSNNHIMQINCKQQTIA